MLCQETFKTVKDNDTLRTFWDIVNVHLKKHAKYVNPALNANKPIRYLNGNGNCSQLCAAEEIQLALPYKLCVIRRAIKR